MAIQKKIPESAFAVEVLNNSTFKSHELYVFCIFFFKENWCQLVTRKWHDLQEKNFLVEYFLSPPQPWGKKIEN